MISGGPRAGNSSQLLGRISAPLGGVGFASFAGTLTADRTYTLPDSSLTFVGTGSANVFTAANTFNGATTFGGTISASNLVQLTASNALALGASAATAGNGILQLTSGTSKFSGIAFGTDTFLYRTGPAALTLYGSYTTLTIDGSSSGGDAFFAAKGTNAQGFIYAGGVNVQVGSQSIIGSGAGVVQFVYGAGSLGFSLSATGIMQGARGRQFANLSVVSSTGTTALTDAEHFVCLTGTTTHTFTLPAASAGRVLWIKNRSTGALTVNRAGSDTIDGGTTTSVAAGAAIRLIANSTDWCLC